MTEPEEEWKNRTDQLSSNADLTLKEGACFPGTEFGGVSLYFQGPELATHCLLSLGSLGTSTSSSSSRLPGMADGFLFFQREPSALGPNVFKVLH